MVQTQHTHTSFAEGSKVTLVFYNIQTFIGTQQCNISLSAIVIPQNANQYSMTQGQVNTLEAFSVQQMVILMQQFRVLQLTKCKFNHKGYYTVTTIKVNHSFSHGNIIRVLSSVNSYI